MKIKITYTAAEAARFERIRAELIQSVPDARQHTSTAPGGTKSGAGTMRRDCRGSCGRAV